MLGTKFAISEWKVEVNFSVERNQKKIKDEYSCLKENPKEKWPLLFLKDIMQKIKSNILTLNLMTLNLKEGEKKQSTRRAREMRENHQTLPSRILQKFHSS